MIAAKAPLSLLGTTQSRQGNGGLPALTPNAHPDPAEWNKPTACS
jgi:hypothetical protein